MAITNVYDLAQYAVEKVGIKSIDWVALANKGRGSIWVRDYMSDYMGPALSQMLATAATLDLVPGGGDAAALQESYSMNKELMDQAAEQISRLVNIPLPSVKMNVMLSREAMRFLISHAYQGALYGCILHQDESIHHSGISDAQIGAHATTVCGVMNAIVLLDKLGFYTAMGMKRGQSGTQGLGIAPLLVAAGVVVAIGALCVAGWILTSIVSMLQTNKIVSTMCQNAQQSGDVETTQQCVKTLTDSSRAAATTVPDTAKAVLKAIAPYALAGLGIYMLFLFAPAFVSSITKKVMS